MPEYGLPEMQVQFNNNNDFIRNNNIIMIIKN